jgi:hypothetical protein
MQNASDMGGQIFAPVTFLLKSIAGGIACLLLAWVSILATKLWSVRNYNAKHGIAGLGATAGGWDALLRSPTVVIILTAAFGIGFYLVVRFSSRG